VEEEAAEDTVVDQASVVQASDMAVTVEVSAASVVDTAASEDLPTSVVAEEAADMEEILGKYLILN